jgi:hypothetical protein
MASKDILVSGTLNLETTFPITGFPFEQSMRDLDVVWISNEPPDLLPDVTQGLSKPWPPGLFLLSMNRRPIAWTDPHGANLDWIADSQPERDRTNLADQGMADALP